MGWQSEHRKGEAKRRSKEAKEKADRDARDKKVERRNRKYTNSMTEAFRKGMERRLPRDIKVINSRLVGQEFCLELDLGSGILFDVLYAIGDYRAHICRSGRREAKDFLATFGHKPATHFGSFHVIHIVEQQGGWLGLIRPYRFTVSKKDIREAIFRAYDAYQGKPIGG